LFQSTDGGSSWSVLQRSGPRAQNLVVNPQDSGTLYAVSDGGGSWNVVLTEVTLHIGYPWVAVAPGAGGARTLYAGGTARGVFRTLCEA